ncbi:MAG: O-methyltransferase [Geodermatophilaceae bacterium]|nr:O-methyltransferase [Geodermatophilaceae bacterium]
MTSKSFFLDEATQQYLVDSTEPADEVLRDLATETATALADQFSMQIAAEQGALLSLLTRALGVTSAIEIGTFTGYSSICIARGLPPGGRLLCLDVSTEWTDIARRYWHRAGLTELIELQVGPALESLQALPSTPTFDLAFIDADKPGYPAYIQELYPRLRTNGLILLDNVLRDGGVLPGRDADEVDRGMRSLNGALVSDQRFDTVMVPVADGLTFLRKR